MIKKLTAMVIAMSSITFLVVACGGASPSCADPAYTVVYERGTSGGGYSSGGARSYSPPAPSSSGTHSVSGSSSGSTGTKSISPSAPSNSGTHSAPAPSGATHTVTPAPNYTSSGGSFTPPRGSVFVVHGTTFPSTYGRSYSYGGHLYVIHPRGYYHMGGYHDPFDPYDWTNYYNPSSPFFHVHATCA